ncbi:hypothetical protein ALC56_05818, partial [Trachymyrmex septentrionalis]
VRPLSVSVAGKTPKSLDTRFITDGVKKIRIIDFTSNPPNMTTVTCQRSRIVSPTGIVPIRRYIFVAFRDFFPKTARRRTASENDQATITCGPFAGRKTGGQPARAFVCRGGRRPDAAWISWKSGGVQHANSTFHPPRSTRGNIKTYRLCIKIFLHISPLCLKII